MRESSHSEKDKAAGEQLPDLEFPIDPHFHSRPPQLTPSEYYHWCMKMNAGVKEDPAARLARKCLVEFVL